MLLGMAVWGGLLPGRLEAISRDISLARNDWDYPGDGVVGEPGDGTVLFFGDSYIRQYYPRIEVLSRSEPWAGKTLLFNTAGGCAPFTGIERGGWSCNDWALAGYRLADRDDVDTIVLGASWIHAVDRGDYYRADDENRTLLDLRSPDNNWIFSQMETRIRQWIENNKRVFIILANPDGDDAHPGSKISDRFAWEPSVTRRKLSLAEHRKNSAFVHGKLRQIAHSTGAVIIDPALWLCRGDVCETESASGIPLYCDDSHLRASFVRDQVHYLDDIVKKNP